MSIIKKMFLNLFFISISIVDIAQAHNHGTSSIETSWTSFLGFKGIQSLGFNIHPVIVHFPIALLIVSFLFYVLGNIFKKSESFFNIGKWMLLIGTAGALGAVATGLLAGNIVEHDEVTHQIMILHQNFGFLVLGLSFLLSLWTSIPKFAFPLKEKGMWFFMTIFAFLILILSQQADLGGQMVYTHGTGVQNISNTHSHEHIE